MVDLVAVPHSAEAQRGFQFITNRLPRRLIRTAARPAGFRITSPVEASVWGSQLPCSVGRYDKTIFRVDEFLADGFVVTDQAPGFTVQGEMSYADLVPPPPEPPASPEAQPLTISRRIWRWLRSRRT
jgi:hypothetical protein